MRKNVTMSMGIICVLLLCSTAMARDVVRPLWESKALFKQPESVVYDPESQLMYVSNVNGAPTEKNQQGFISQMNLRGEITHLRWITQLNAPKGLAIYKGKLYVADIDELLVIQCTSGKVIKRYPAPQAQFLNDIAIDAHGVVYVSDMDGNAVYRLRKKKFTLWIEDKHLDHPNGLVAEADRLIVGSWGALMPGYLKEIYYDDAIVRAVGKEPVGKCDGIVPDGKGNYYITDHARGILLHVTEKGESSMIQALRKGCADLTRIPSKKMLIIPFMRDNRVVALKEK